MHRATLIAGVLLAVGGAVWLTQGAVPTAPASAAEATEPRDRGVDRGDGPSEPAGTAARATVAVPPAPQAPTTLAPLDFDAAIDELVDLALTTLTSGRAGDATATAAATERAESLLARVRAEIRDAGMRALGRFARTVALPVSERAAVERGVLVRLLADVLAEGHARAGSDRAPTQVDRLVDAVLSMLPESAATCAALARLLVATPYLGASHEGRVLELAALAEDVEHLRAVAADLLTTLWQNLERRGERSSQQLAALALLFGAEAEPTRRAAALEYLLVADGGRYREVALARAVETGDADLIAALATHAAGALPVEAAIAALEKLAARRPDATTVGWLTLAHRDPAALRAGYERRLADAVQPGLRAELVSAALLSQHPDAVAVASTAFDLDPDPTVRCRALCALTGAAPREAAVAALGRAIDDPLFRADALRLETLVDALENLAVRGDPSAIPALAARIEAIRELPQSARRRLAGLRAQWVPRGG